MRYHRSMNRYTYRVEWSSEYGEYVGRCLELPWLSQWAATMQKAIASVEQAVDDYIVECEATERNVPPPVTERRFSGKFLVRTSSALHARLTVEAAEQNVSMNQWVVQKLADRPPIGLFDL
jgi:predicted HicB family RNase H-like nuclease